MKIVFYIAFILAVVAAAVMALVQTVLSFPFLLFGLLLAAINPLWLFGLEYKDGKIVDMYREVWFNGVWDRMVYRHFYLIMILATIFGTLWVMRI